MLSLSLFSYLSELSTLLNEGKVEIRSRRGGERSIGPPVKYSVPTIRVSNATRRGKRLTIKMGKEMKALPPTLGRSDFVFAVEVSLSLVERSEQMKTKTKGSGGGVHQQRLGDFLEECKRTPRIRTLEAGTTGCCQSD